MKQVLGAQIYELYTICKLYWNKCTKHQYAICNDNELTWVCSDITDASLHTRQINIAHTAEEFVFFVRGLQITWLHEWKFALPLFGKSSHIFFFLKGFYVIYLFWTCTLSWLRNYFQFWFTFSFWFAIRLVRSLFRHIWCFDRRIHLFAGYCNAGIKPKRQPPMISWQLTSTVKSVGEQSQRLLHSNIFGSATSIRKIMTNVWKRLNKLIISV